MVCKPEELIFEKNINIKESDSLFKIKNFGGYLKNNKNKKEFIRQSQKCVTPTKLMTLDLTYAVNYLSSIEYSINNNVLNYIFDLFIKNDKKNTRFNKNRFTS
jgi:hypothetical protein